MRVVVFVVLRGLGFLSMVELLMCVDFSCSLFCELERANTVKLFVMTP